MGHVLGIGTSVESSSSRTPAAALDRGRHRGSVLHRYHRHCAVQRQWRRGVRGARRYPSRTPAGPGTRDGHWRESVMGKELMTGCVSLIANPLSAITVGSLADMGYTISYANADPYTVNRHQPAGRSSRGLSFHCSRLHPTGPSRPSTPRGGSLGCGRPASRKLVSDGLTKDRAPSPSRLSPERGRGQSLHSREGPPLTPV